MIYSVIEKLRANSRPSVRAIETAQLLLTEENNRKELSEFLYLIVLLWV